MTEEIKKTGCCEPFDPAPWQEKEMNWDKKIFVKDYITSFFAYSAKYGQ